jgi:large-conductance mechanosensitive channel
LTPGLIVTLLVSFFIIGPVVFLGISALASIQSPLRLDLPKGYNAQTKKNI